MLENLIKREGVFDNLIGLVNLLESETRILLEELDITQIEFSILAHISNAETTQYKISKKYNISVQRAHQIIKKLVNKEYITAEKGVTNGRACKRLTVKPGIELKVDRVNNLIINNLKTKKIKYSSLKEFNNLLKLFLNNF